MTELRADCELSEDEGGHEWVPCEGCPRRGWVCPCAGGICCQREAVEIQDGVFDP